MGGAIDSWEEAPKGVCAFRSGWPGHNVGGGFLYTIVHWLLAVILTLFLALQARSLLVVLRHRRATVTGRHRRGTDLLWTCIPVVVVLLLAARSWVAVLGLAQPEIAAAVTKAEPGAARRAALQR